jgi:hypothetical protein
MPRGAFFGVSPASYYRPIGDFTADVPFPEGQCTSILASAAGTLTLVDARGVTRASYPLQEGYNPIRATAFSGTPLAGVWFLFD